MWYIPDSKHDGSKCSMHSAENVAGPDHFALVSLTFDARNCLYLGSAGNKCWLTPSLVVLLHPAAIHLVGIAGKMHEKFLFWITKRNVQAHYSHVCIQRKCRQLRGGSMFDRGEVFLEWRHKKGWAEPPPTTLSIVLTYKSWQTITQKIVLLLVNIQSYVKKKKKIYFQVPLSNVLIFQF